MGDIQFKFYRRERGLHRLRTLSEQQRCIWVRQAEGFEPHIGRARSVVGEFDVICQQDVR